jgi:hypothetical protein
MAENWVLRNGQAVSNASGCVVCGAAETATAWRHRHDTQQVRTRNFSPGGGGG